MTNLKIRIATTQDIDDIVLLENSFPSEIYSKEELLKMFTTNYYHFFVAEKDNAIVGYLCSTIIFDECNILKIIVNKNFQRQGIGNRLISNLKEICLKLNVKKIYLEVSVQNNNAINFYEKLGFEYINTREKYYGNVDAKIYEMSVE